jgi:AcrR family transcriptional regulator
VTRKADEANRTQLLEKIVAYVLANGMGSLSLRPLAKEIGVSAASLLYHFHSKEELTVEILKHAGDAQRELFASMWSAPDGQAPADMCRAIWRILAAPAARPLFRLFFEVYGLALIDPARFPGFFPAAVWNWIGFLERAYIDNGCAAEEARTLATIVLAGFRGFLLDLCATGDDERLERAVAAWIAVLP